MGMLIYAKNIITTGVILCKPLRKETDAVDGKVDEKSLALGC